MPGIVGQGKVNEVSRSSTCPLRGEERDQGSKEPVGGGGGSPWPCGRLFESHALA